MRHLRIGVAANAAGKRRRRLRPPARLAPIADVDVLRHAVFEEAEAALELARGVVLHALLSTFACVPRAEMVQRDRARVFHEVLQMGVLPCSLLAAPFVLLGVSDSGFAEVFDPFPWFVHYCGAKH